MSEKPKDQREEPEESFNETKELIKSVKNLANKITRLEKESRMGLEDQLSFGVIISLVVFILALPLDEITLFFQNLGLSSGISLQIAGGVRNTGLLCLILATATRYYGAISKQRISKRFRRFSLQFLIAAWNFFLIIFVMFSSIDASVVLGTMSLPIAICILVVIFSIMIRAEKRVLEFYASKEFIFKKDVKPTVSTIFLILIVGYYFAFVGEFIAVIKGMIFSSERFMAVWLLSSILIIVLPNAVNRLKRIRRKGGEKKAKKS